ncbi:potassium channel family protein [Sulfitobacter sp. R18_1]|uniref:potassium channel family protein n=1 Tax=Sulfitobacter sp. R18_1 TaxID=2821104 RepID=UPI001ADC51DF|nr:potassium channel family protein [Sulfitobacter sp. R18_1]MBO9428304.1 potassium channel protein [Sulfitobacter sp. R18_1]
MQKKKLVDILRRWILRAMSIRWSTIGYLFAVHFALSFAAFSWAGEESLTNSLIDYLYFWVTTGSTVGYGDLSPSTQWGRLYTSFLFQPGANALFLLTFGKLGTELLNIRDMIMNGFGNFADKEDHVVIIGYQPGRTDRLISEGGSLMKDADVVLVTAFDGDVHLRGATHVVKTANLSDTDALERAGVKGAQRVVIMPANDSDTLSAGLAVMSLKPQGHVIAYFEEPRQAELLERHCPEIENVVSTSVEQVSRALTDPGSSRVLYDLASLNTEFTLYSSPLPDGNSVNAETPDAKIKEAGGNMIGYRRHDSEDINFSFQGDCTINPGDIIYYIARERLDCLG